MYGLEGTKFKTAEEYWSNPPVAISERLQGHRDQVNRRKDHEDYMNFAELYADYVVAYEKANSK